MSDGFKTTLATIGSVIFIFFLAFCIGMCTSGFRNKVYDILDVVPESGQNEILDENNTLRIQIEEYTAQINALNNNRAELLAKISELDLTNQQQAILLMEYQNQISNLNQQIINLTQKLNQISSSVNNAIINYRGNPTRVFFPIFDIDNTYMNHGGLFESDGIWVSDGFSLRNEMEWLYLNFDNNILTGVQSGMETYLYTIDRYEISIDGAGTLFDVEKDRYGFDNNVSVNTIITLNGVEIPKNDVMNLIDNYMTYEIGVDLDYCVNVDNLVSELICRVNINQI